MFLVTRAMLPAMLELGDGENGALYQHGKAIPKIGGVCHIVLYFYLQLLFSNDSNLPRIIVLFGFCSSNSR